MTRLTFTASPYGLEPETEFELAPVEGADGLATLRAAGTGVRMFVLDATACLGDYRPPIAAFDLAQLDAEAESLRVLVVVNPSGEQTTVNLAAPILVSPQGTARQVILDGEAWPLRQPLAEALAATA